MIRRMLILAAVALVAFAPSAHAQYDGGSATVSDSTVTQGQTVTVSADGCEPGSEVTFSFDGTAAGTATTDDEGVASTTITIPDDASAGEHSISNSCNDAVLTVVVEGAAATATGTDALPRTGSDSSLPLAKVAIVLIAAGGLLVLVSRDRSSRKATA